MTNGLVRAGELVAASAIAEWQRDIYDAVSTDRSAEGQRSIAYIDALTRACNYGRYTGNDMRPAKQWCTMWGSKRWVDAGGLDPSMLAHFSQSTLRWRYWAQYLTSDGAHPSGEKPNGDDRRLYVDLQKPWPNDFAPRAGDLMVVGDGEPFYGDHGVVVITYDPITHSVDTIAGNGGGIGPRGNKREGVSRKTFSLRSGAGYHEMFLVRPAFGNLLAETPAIP